MRDAFGVSKGLPSALRGLSHPVSATIKDATAAKYVRLRLNAHDSGQHFPVYRNDPRSPFTQGQMIGHGRMDKTRSKTVIRQSSRGMLKSTQGRVLP